MSDIDDRSKLLLGENFFKLKNKKVVVIGLGGVGSIVPISLVRSGIKELTIIDGDRVDESNLNRQIAYFKNDVGRYKADALKDKLLEIRDDIKIKNINLRIDENFDFDVFNDADFICDCIDDLKAKVLIAKEAIKRDIKFISSLGMGNRLDPSKVIITKLNKTTDDPLAKKLRYMLRKEEVDISKINVSFSLEKPIIKSTTISSMAFVPNTSGLNIASFIIQEFIKE